MPHYMYIEGVRGSVWRKDERWIPIESFSITGQNISDRHGLFTVVKFYDQSTIELIEYTRHSGLFTVTIESVNDDRNGYEEAPYLVHAFERVHINMYRVGASDEYPVVYLSFGYEKLVNQPYAPGKTTGKTQGRARAEQVLRREPVHASSRSRW